VIGVWKAYSSLYLYAVAVGMLVAFGLPLLVAPAWLFGLLGWDIPQPDHMIVILGRSLGGIICVLGGFAIKAARTPGTQPFFFALMLWIFLAMIPIHIYGAITGIQPVAETVEIAVWVFLFVVTLGFYPTGSLGGGTVS